VDPARREQLIELLDIDLRWRMHRVSDGQRRRVQICMNLLRPFQVCKQSNDIHSELLSSEGLLFVHTKCRPIPGSLSTVLSPASAICRTALTVEALRGTLVLVPFLSMPSIAVCALVALQVLLLDEVTVDLDVVARMDLLQFFKEECEQVRSWLLAPALA